MTDNLDEVLTLFPTGSEIPQIVRSFISNDKGKRRTASKELRAIVEKRSPTAQESQAILATVSQLKAPVERGFLEINWAEELVKCLWDYPSNNMVAPAKIAYAVAKDRCGASILSLFGAIGSREAAIAFVDCIRQYGWPEDAYERIFTELNNLLEFCDVLFPELISLANGWLRYVGGTLLAGLASSKVAPSQLAGIQDFVEQQLKLACAQAEKFQSTIGIAWRFEKDYHSVRYNTGFLLELAGWLNPVVFETQLRSVCDFHDPHLALFAVTSLLRGKRVVPPHVIEKIAASHEMRSPLFRYLKNLNQLERFPRGWCTWEAFAAADMVNWLTYPTELGREPDQLEKMAVYEGRDSDGPARLYVWRFRGFDGKWCAAISGPYSIVGESQPVSGSSTFSSFDEWDSASAEEHAGSILETLEEWRLYEENGGNK